MTTDPAINVTRQTVPIYQPDPRGHRLFANLSAALNGNLTGQRAVVSRDSARFEGWAKAPQRFRGAAALGKGRPIAPSSSQLDRESSRQITDPVTAALFKRGTGS